MRVDLEAKVRTSDGHLAGTVRRVVWNPERGEVEEFVVASGGLLGHDVLVGRDALEGASHTDDVIVVDMTRDELHRQRPYDEASYSPPPQTWQAPVAYGYGMPAYVWPVVTMSTGALEGQPPAEPRMPSIDKGMPVKDGGGETIGEAHQVAIDDHGAIRALVVRRGGALERLTGGGERIEVAVGDIDVSDDAVHLVGEHHARPSR